MSTTPLVQLKNVNKSFSGKQVLKYDLRYIYKTLGIYYILALACVIVGRLLNIEGAPFFVEFIAMFLQNAGLGFAAGLVFNAVVRSWGRFRINLYGDESYLTHTIPVERGTLYTAKFLSNLITVFLSIIILAVTLYIRFPDLISVLDLPMPLIFLFPLIIFLELTFIVQCGFTGIAIGHRFDSHRLLSSVISGIIVYLIGNLIILGAIFLNAVFSPTLMDFLLNGASGNPPLSILSALFAVVSAVYFVLILATYIIGRVTISRGVNVN